MKKNLILITSITLVLLMTLSLVSAGWFTGKAVDYASRFYKGQSRTISGTDSKLSISDVKDDSVVVTIDGDSALIYEGSSEVVGGYSIEVVDARPAFLIRRDSALLRISEAEGCNGNLCVLYEGDSVNYNGNTFSIEYLDSDEVRFYVDDEVVPSSGKLKVGGSYKLSDGSYIGIQDISKLESAGEKGRVEFIINFSSTCVSDSCMLYEGDSVNYHGKTFFIAYLDSDEVRFYVDDEVVPSRGTLKVGDAITLEDGSSIRVGNINRLEVSGGIGRVEFTFTSSIYSSSDEVTYADPTSCDYIYVNTEGLNPNEIDAECDDFYSQVILWESVFCSGGYIPYPIGYSRVGLDSNNGYLPSAVTYTCVDSNFNFKLPNAVSIACCDIKTNGQKIEGVGKLASETITKVTFDSRGNPTTTTN